MIGEASFNATGDWTTFQCPESTKRWRELGDGRIEIEGEGTVARDWPEAVNQWADLVAAKSAKYSMPASWIAAIIAIESGGKSDVCYKIGGRCSTVDGAGLMAMLSSTAKSLIGREVSPEEMMSNPDLAVDLGTMLMSRIRERTGDDFVKIAISYNAGGIRCRSGTSGATVPDGRGARESCPQTDWGVSMGCIRTSRAINQYCGPSKVVAGMFVCPVSYPYNAITSLNAAVDNGWTQYGLGLTGPATPGGTIIRKLVPFAAGAALGFLGVKTFLPSLKRI